MPGITPYTINTNTGGGSSVSTRTGVVNLTGNNIQDTFSFPHGLGVVPSYANVLPKNAAAIGDYSVDWDITNITIMYTVAPISGTLTLTWITVS